MTTRDFDYKDYAPRQAKTVGEFNPDEVYTTAKEACATYGGSIPTWSRWIRNGDCGRIIEHHNKRYITEAAAKECAAKKGLTQ